MTSIDTRGGTVQTDIYQPANDIQRDEMRLEQLRREYRIESRKLVLGVIRELGATAADGIPVYVVARQVSEKYPSIGEYRAREAFDELWRDGSVGWDATRDRALLTD